MANQDNDTSSADILTLPEGRVINSSLFVKDKFNDKSTPSYKIELAFDENDPGLDAVEEALERACDDRWGDGTYENAEKLINPLLDGNKLAKKRERKGKQGDAYKGKTVIRANTIYNRHGEDGPGGVQVYDEDVNLVEPANSSKIYNGCMGVAAVTISTYEKEDDEGDMVPALKFYLTAFQKTGDGEKLAGSADRSTLFKPVGRERSGESGGRRRRSR